MSAIQLISSQETRAPSCCQKAVTPIVAALFAIAALAGIFCILASHGIPLGPLNILAEMPRVAAYVLATAGLVGLIVNLIFICKGEKSTTQHVEKTRSPNVQVEKTRSPNVQVEKSSPPNVLDKESKKAHSEVCLWLEKLKEEDFFKSRSHTAHADAKALFTQTLKSCFGATVSFPTPPPIDLLDVAPLDKSVFSKVLTSGIEGDIFAKASLSNEKLYLFQVASRYNGAEATGHSPEIAKAMKAPETGKTQGLLAQRTNPALLELVNALLSNKDKGFNMLYNVFHPSDPMYHGLLFPTAELTNKMIKNYTQMEYVCYESIVPHYSPFYLMLQTAPASASAGQQGKVDQLEQCFALANYSALFQQGIRMALDSDKPVIIQATALGAGGGTFGNSVKNLVWGFVRAASALQVEMKRLKVEVRLASFEGTDWVNEMCKQLKL